MENTDSTVMEGSEGTEGFEAEETQEQEDVSQESVEAAPVRNVKKLRLKVDGEEIEEEIDLDDEENLKRHLQLSKAAQKRMNEAARSKKEVENLYRTLQADPIAALSKMGLNVREITENWLAAQLQEEMLTPEQKKVRDAEKILKEREEEQRTAKEKQEHEEMERLQSQYADNYQKVIISALDKGGVPRNPMTVKRMAYYLKQNIQHGLDLSPDDLVDFVRRDYQQDLRDLTSSADGEALIKMFGDDVVNKIRQTSIKNIKNPTPKGSQESRGSQSGKDSSPKNLDDVFEDIRKGR